MLLKAEFPKELSLQPVTFIKGRRSITDLLKMSDCPIHLVAYRQSPAQRAHFAILIPSRLDPEVGTLIHAVGAPMHGYELEFQRNYSLASDLRTYTTVTLGSIEAQHIAEATSQERISDNSPKSDIERAASQVPTPRVSQNFMAPVNDVSEDSFMRRCFAK